MRDDDCPFCLAPQLWKADQPQRLEVEYRGTWYEGIWAPLSEDLYVHYIFDITDHKRAEEALRESEERFRSVFERSALGIMRVALDGKPLETNPAFERMVGYNHAELRKISYADITHPDDIEKENTLAKELLETKLDNFTLEKRYIRKDGNVIWCNLTVSTVYGPDGKPKNYVSIIEDITERKRAEEGLRESEERMKLAIEKKCLQDEH